MRRPLALLFLSLFVTAALGQPAEFFAESIYQIAGATYDVRSVDLDHDGDRDLVATAQGSAGVSVLLNEGDGTFAPAVFYEVAGGIRSVAVGDFNGDGDPDVVASAAVQTIYFLPGAGDGTLGEPVPSVENDFGGNAVDLAEADFDGDGDLDVAALTARVVLLFTGNGDGTFTRTDFVSVSDGSFLYGGLVAQDLNGDAFPDVCFGNGESQLFVAFNDMEGNLGDAIEVAADVDAYDITTADVDGDGDPDVVATGMGTIQVFGNDGSGAFASIGGASASGFSIGNSISAADLNLDGHVDVVVTAGAGGIDPYYGAGDGSFEAGSTIPTSLGNHYALVADDLSGDGKPDLVAANTINTTENELVVRLNATVPPDPILAADDDYTTDVNTRLDVAAPGVLENDSGAAPLTAAKLTNPTNGEADVFPDGSLFYIPFPDFSGDDSFTYEVTGADGQTAEATVRITVNPPPPPPAAEPLFLAVDDETGADEPWIVRKRAGLVNVEYLATIAAGEGGEILLNLFDDVELLAYQERVEWRGEAQFTWYGRFHGNEVDRAVLVVNLETSTITGRITRNLDPIALNPVPGGLHEARELEPSAFPEGDDTPDEEDEIAGKAEPIVQPRPPLGRTADSHPIIDILIVYTDDAAAATPDIVGEMQLAIDLTNIGFDQSGVNAEVRLVGLEEVNYDETENGRTDRNRIRKTSDGHLDHVHALRDQLGADVVAFVVEEGGDDLCGVAYIMKQTDGSYRDRAFFVVQRDCANGNLSFPHELGHVMGARHDRFVDNTDGSPFDYNHGFKNRPDRWRTIMSYNDECDPAVCRRINWWSNPDNSFNRSGNTAPGGKMGNPDSEDNVRALNNTAAVVAAYSDQVHWEISGFITHQGSGDPFPGIIFDEFLVADTTDADGYYEGVVPDGWSGVLAPKAEDHVFEPPNAFFGNVSSDQTQDFVAIPRTVSGYVLHRDTGDPIPGVIMDGLPVNDTTDANGYYERIVPHEWSGIVTPVKAPFRFNPPQYGFAVVTEPVEQDFLAVPPPTITGTIRDSQTGNPIVAAELLGFPDVVETDFAGNYTAFVDFGWSGTVIPVAAGYNMNPASRVYEDVFNDLENQDYIGMPGVVADSEWPLVGRDQARLGAGASSPVEPAILWEVEYLNVTPRWPVTGPGGLVYFITGDGFVHALDPDGNPLWSDRSNSYGDALGLAVGAGGVVYTVQSTTSVSPAAAASALKPDGSGDLWLELLSGEELSTAPNLGDSGELYVGTEVGILIALDAVEGSEKWRYDTGGGILSSTALAADGTIYFGTSTGGLFAVESGGTTATLSWQMPTVGGADAGPVVGDDGTIYLGTDAGMLYAVDTQGSMKWSFMTNGAIEQRPAVGRNGEIYVVDSDDILYGIGSGGSEKWRHDIGAAVTTAPVASTYASPLGGILPGSNQTETVVYVGAADGTVHAINAGGTFTQSVPGTLRWSLDLGGAVSSDMAVSFADRTLYVTTPGHVHAVGEAPSGSGSGLVQLTSIGTYVDPDVLELRDNIHILITFAENGFGGGAIVGGLPDDPCTGGPLFIPDCGDLRSGFGTTTPRVDVAAGAEIRFGFVEEGTAPEVLEGNLGGLLGTYVGVLEAGKEYAGVIAGTTNPELLALNPDLRSTRMTVFQAPTEAPAGGGTPVYAGHFSTDLPAVQMTLHGGMTYEMGALKYGEFSDVMLLEPGQYVAEIQQLNGIAGKSDAAGPTLYLPVTVGEGENGLKGILISGFLNPNENLGGPALGTVQTDGEGLVEISALEQKEAAREIVVSLLDETGAETLAEALSHLDASLMQELWLDGRHLAPETGETVFDEEKDAIRELEKFVTRGATGTHADRASLAILYLVVADDVLATALIGDAEAICDNPTCARELDKARDALADARALLGEENVQRSIRSYAHAWESAYEALVASGAAGKSTADADVPNEFALAANYPNPFNPVTVIGYALHEESDVRLEVFDVLGRSVAVLVDGPKGAGRHEVSFDAGRLAGGVYLYRLTAGDRQVAKTMTLLK